MPIRKKHPAGFYPLIDPDFDDMDGGLDQAVEDITEFGYLSATHIGAVRKHLPHLPHEEDE